MPRVSTYLNFRRETEAAFLFYRSVFGTEFNGPIRRMGEVPLAPDQAELSSEDQQLVMHVELPIFAGHVLMGADMPDSMGFSLVQGTNCYINLEPDTRAEADHLFAALMEGGTVEVPLTDMFWGGYYGSLIDRFGTRWMFNVTPTS